MLSVTEKQGLYDRMNEFDPIKQHRTFCPWISPDYGEPLPGWRLTLSALLTQDKRSDGDLQVEVQTSLLDEVGAFIESCLVSLERNLTVGFLWFRRMTLLLLLESSSWHHLQKDGGYNNPKRAEKWELHPLVGKGLGQTHTVRNIKGQNQNGIWIECWNLKCLRCYLCNVQMLGAAAGKRIYDLVNCSRTIPPS